MRSLIPTSMLLLVVLVGSVLTWSLSWSCVHNSVLLHSPFVSGCLTYPAKRSDDSSNQLSFMSISAYNGLLVFNHTNAFITLSGDM